MRLSIERKQAREEAGFYGRRCVMALEMLASLGDGLPADELAERAEDLTHHAYYFARKAGRFALKARGGKP